MRRVREGSEAAAWELVDRYGGHLRRAVRRVLNARLRSKFDSLDFVQLVWKSFFRLRESADRFQRPQHLVAFLASMARNKVGMEACRQLMTQQYDIRREVPLNRSLGEDGRELAGQEPGPVDVAIARERRERLLRDLPLHYRRMVELKLLGHTAAEIAAILGVDSQTVRRFFKRYFDEMDVAHG